MVPHAVALEPKALCVFIYCGIIENRPPLAVPHAVCDWTVKRPDYLRMPGRIDFVCLVRL